MKACAVPNGAGEYPYTSAVADLHEGFETELRSLDFDKIYKQSPVRLLFNNFNL